MTTNKKLPDNQITVYQAPDGKINIEVLYANENIWLPQKRMAELFGCSVGNISLHLKKIYDENELDESSTIEDYSTVQIEGNREINRTVRCYSLEAIIAVGYRVNSERGTQFRQWAISILQQYIHKGFAMDSDRFKYGSRFSTRYFDDLLEEIRDIRSSERMLYQKITDIYATSIDYSPKAEDTKQFFATVQNKLHFAITGQTAAEIVAERAKSDKPNMGLTSWRKGPDGKIMPNDVAIAKNYLDKTELDHLNRIVTMYLDYAELQAVRNKPMYMKDWIEKLHFAITGQTAAEIVAERAKSDKPNMGLTSWRKGPDGKIMPNDVAIAKNYLDKTELDHLNRIVTMYLDYAELQAVRNKPMYMKDWIEKLNAFLKFSEYEILTNARQISHEVALALASKEYETFKKVQDEKYISDFDKEVWRIREGKDGYE